MGKWFSIPCFGLRRRGQGEAGRWKADSKRTGELKNREKAGSSRL